MFLTIESLEEFKEKFMKTIGLTITKEEKESFSNLSDKEWSNIFKNLKEKEQENINYLKKVMDHKNIKSFYQIYLPNFKVDFFSEEPHNRMIFISHHDNVPYTFCDTGNIDFSLNPIEKLESNIKHSSNHFKLTIERHHKEVKSVYNYLKSKGFNDVVCLIGGGCQLQVFFNIPNQNIGTLHLSLNNEKYDQSNKVYLSQNIKDVFKEDFDTENIILN